MTLACEKFHIQGLLTRARQLLETQEPPLESQILTGRKAEVPAVGEADWAIGELGLGYHECAVVRVASPMARPEPRRGPRHRPALGDAGAGPELRRAGRVVRRRPGDLQLLRPP